MMADDQGGAAPCGSLPGNTGEPARIYNTHGSTVESKWTIVKGTPTDLDPQQTVIENGIIRLAYPCKLGVPGRPDAMEKAGHVLYLKRGGKYQLAQDDYFGDWTYVGNSFVDDPTAFHVLRNSADLVEVTLEFPSHKDWDGQINGCRKHVIVQRGHSGYTVRIEEENTLPGEREAGFGNAKSRWRSPAQETGHFFAYSTKTAYLWSPDDPVTERFHYEFLRDEDGGSDWWGAAIAFRKSYYRLVALKPQFPQSPTIRSGSFPGSIAGLIRYRSRSMEETGYEVYIAAVPYDGREAQHITVKATTAVVRVPKPGHYTVFTEGVTDGGGSRHYERAIQDVKLSAGVNRVEIAGRTMANPVVVPLWNGRDFPDDLWRVYCGLPARQGP